MPHRTPPPIEMCVHTTSGAFHYTNPPHIPNIGEQLCIDGSYDTLWEVVNVRHVLGAHSIHIFVVPSCMAPEKAG